jgi:phospholipase/carboxylesterase
MREERWGGLDCLVIGGEDKGSGPIVVFLHGFGAPGDDLVGLAHELRVPPGVRYVFPAAPLELGWGMGDSRAWWMIDMERLERDREAGRVREISEAAPEGLLEARALLQACLAEAVAKLGAQAPLVLGGFSQGAMLSCDVALCSPLPLAGLVLMSGTPLTPREWTPRMPARAKVPIVMSHGRADPLLPFAHAVQLRDAWRSAGATVDWIEFDGGHEITHGVLAGVQRLIVKAAGASATG